MTNEDVSHLYERVKIGTRVVVLRGDELQARLAPSPTRRRRRRRSRSPTPGSRTMRSPASASWLGVAVAGTVPAPEALPSK